MCRLQTVSDYSNNPMLVMPFLNELSADKVNDTLAHLLERTSSAVVLVFLSSIEI